MQKGFWEKLDKPILALAPLHDVTDTVFRQMIVRKGKPDVMFTEFVSVDGLLHEQSREKMIWRYLRFDNIERPIVAQIWGTDPKKFEAVAEQLVELGFDGIDINMGCPEKSAVKKGACSALIDEPKLAQEIIQATIKGAGDLPVSVKTRMGFKGKVVEEWVKHLLETEPVAITMHGRLAKDMSKKPADWEAIGKTVELAKGSETLILGNGDVKDMEDAQNKVKIYGVDGVMFGRAIFQNHWLFAKDRKDEPTDQEKLQAMIDHARLYEKTFEDRRTFAVMRKHLKAYTSSIKSAKKLRVALMTASNADEVEDLVNKYLSGTDNAYA